MREIKFRQWKPTQKEMEYLDWLPSDREDDIWMQYTGLKDKNGKEIYEGDIVIAYSEGQKGKFEVRWRQEASPCYILYPAWQNGTIWHISATENHKGKQFIGVDAKIETTNKEGYYDDGLEIIGNIYENPELLQANPREEI